jgi:hypothetical protein
MLFWTVQTILISFVLIFLVHHLITYFKQILTVPKTKDLVNSPIQKYNDMFKIIGSTESSNSNVNQVNPNINIEDYLPKPGFTPEEIKNDVNQEMKNELKSFLKKQMTHGSSNSATTTTDISTLDSFGSSSYYSNY